MKTINTTLALALFSIANPVLSGILEQATFEGQVQVQIDQGLVASCGVRILGAANNISQKIIGVDTSVIVAKPGFGMVKGLVYQGTLEQYAKGDLSRLQLRSIWLRKPDGQTTVPNKGEYLESPETERAIIYPTSVDSALDILDAVLERQAIQIGFRLADDPYDRAYFGVVEMTDPEMTQLAQCLTAWAGSMLKQSKPQKPKNRQ